MTVPENEIAEENKPDVNEGKARRMGWVPEEEYRGDKSKWVDADTFIARGESTLPILKERYDALDSKLTQMQQTIKEFNAHHLKTLAETKEIEYNRALADLKSKQRQAVEEGDTERFDAVEDEINSLTPPKPVEPIQVDPNKAVTDSWISKNPWFNADNEMRQYAISMEGFLGFQNPGSSYGELLDKVAAEVKVKYPERFGGTSKRNAPAGVYGGDDAPPVRNNGKKTYADLPPEAKEACTKFVSQGLLTKDQYIKDYFQE